MAKVVVMRLFGIHRYKVHPKLVSFMAPVGRGKMSDIARYRSAIASTNNLYVPFFPEMIFSLHCLVHFITLES